MGQVDKNNVTQLLYQLNRLSSEQFMQFLSTQFPNQLIFSTSFSVEDQVITHQILSHHLPIKIFTLDTGRLFAETYSTWSNTNEKFQTKIKAYYPNENDLQNFVQENGPNAFYETVEKRKQCCAIRKTAPLKKALASNAVWITGLRAQHSASRSNLPILEWDEANKIIKYHPLLNWTTEEVKLYIENHQIPYNPLQDKGFVSIGCAPCTRAIRSGEDFRAGRWWWEDSDKKECGLHTTEALQAEK